jgi:protein involved in polysaccharide export with SLBB domain
MSACFDRRLFIWAVLFSVFSLASVTGDSFSQEIQAVPVGPAAQSSAGPASPSLTPQGTASSIDAQQLQQLQQLQQQMQPQQLDQLRQKAASDLGDKTDTRPKTKGDMQAERPVGPSSADTISEFERYVIDGKVGALSTDIRQFGYNLFSMPPSTFAPDDKVPVSPDYVIGPGDEIKITIWGRVDANWSLTVDNEGKLTIPKVGTVGVAGLSFRELKTALQGELSRLYTGFEMNISMGSLRTIRVYMVGNAYRPGAYTISSLSTLVNALFAAGGPSKTGSMRDIQVKRHGRTITHFDLYDFLLKGDKSRDIRLMPEDVIFIPPVGPLVAVAGNVKKPAIYELRGKTGLLDLIKMTGGLGNTAFKGRVQVMRIDGVRFRMIFEGDLLNIEKDASKNFTLNDGDILKIFSVVDLKTTVTIAGAVAMPGDFGVEAGVTHIKDIISKAGGMLYYSADTAELTRVKVTQEGPQTERILLDVGRAMKGDPKHNIALEINDYIFIRTVPEWDLYKVVDLQGEVKYPGRYSIKRGERLSSVIERAGGYTAKAYLPGSFFTRLSVKEMQQRGMEEMIKRLERELLAESSTQIVGTTVTAADMQNQKSALEARHKFLEVLRKQKALGRMTIRLAELNALKKSEFDIELEDGDALSIPKLNSVINVTGAVMSPGSHIYSQQFDYKDYIEMSGSYSQHADPGNTYVIRADGSAKKLARGFFSWSNSRAKWEYGGEPGDIGPGDTIVVPENLERVVWLREVKDITQTIMQIAVAAGVFFAMK